MKLWDVPSVKTLPKSDVLVCCHITNPGFLWGVDDTVWMNIIKQHMNYRYNCKTKTSRKIKKGGVSWYIRNIKKIRNVRKSKLNLKNLTGIAKP